MKSNTLAIFSDQRNEIVQQWAASSAQDIGFHPGPDEQVCREICNALITDDNTGSIRISRPLTTIIDDLCIHWSAQEYSPEEVAAIFFNLQHVLTDTLERSIQDRRELLLETRELHKLVDNIVIIALESLINNREGVIFRQAGELKEITTPVIKIWDGILGLPVIGTLDSSRIEEIIENVLVNIANEGYQVIIVDISGIAAIDSAVADHLLKLNKAVKLMGAQCVVSGMRPSVAQTIVNLGLDLSSMITKATLASALNVAFNLLNLQLINKRLISINK